MRILFLSNFYPPQELGGYEQWCEEIALRLIDRGHQVDVLTSNFHNNNSQLGDPEYVDRDLFLQTDIAYYKPLDFFLTRPSQERKNIEALKNNIHENSPDIIMVWGMWNLSHTLPYYAEQWMPGRVAYFISNYWPIDPDPHTTYWNLPTHKPMIGILKSPLRSLALNTLKRENYPPTLNFDFPLCCSNYVRETLVSAGKIPAQAKVLYGGTDPDPFLAQSVLDRKQKEVGTPLRLVYFGRLIHDKGVHTAIEALGFLKTRGHTSVELTIIGSGHPDYEAHLHTLVKQLSLTDRTHFISQVPRTTIPEWLGKFDAYLFTSIWPEPMARSVMEAMAAGLLVIGTEVGGQPEMLFNGENSLTYSPDDSNDLADQIEKVLIEPKLIHNLAKAGQELVLKQFTLDRMVNQIEEYLLDIVKYESIPTN